MSENIKDFKDPVCLRIAFISISQKLLNFGVLFSSQKDTH
jgi:hypothetical protein